MKVIENFKYTKDHEWINIDNGVGIIGVSDFAQGELGDIVFVELPNIGDLFSKNDIFGTVEAVKTVADLYIPLSGEIIDINTELESAPELINKDPYDKGWIIKIRIKNSLEAEELLNSNQYKDLIK